MDKKQQEVVTLANKGGRDAELMLLDKIHELEDALANAKADFEGKLADVKATAPDLDKVLTSVRGTQGEKGVDGADGEDGLDGQDGIDGEDGEPGQKGDKGDAGKDGEDGKDGRDGTDGKDGSPDTALQIRDKLETLTGDDRIDASAIKGIEDYAEVSRLAREGTKVVAGRSVPRVFVIDLSSKLDGSTKSFTLPTNFGIIAVNSSSAPFGAFVPITDYAQLGKNIVFTQNVDAPSALASGQSLTVTILK